MDDANRAEIADTIKADIIEKNGIKAFNAVQHSVREVSNARTRSAFKSPMYTYKFMPDIPGYDHPGDFHSCDLWFFFETIQKCWRPYNGHHYELARMMCDYWCNFMKTGDPNGTGYDEKTLPKWKRVTAGDPESYEMIFV